MKIYILTFQYAKNFGAILQAYSLSSYLNNKPGVDCQLLQYMPTQSSNSWKIYSKWNDIRLIIRNLYLFLRPDIRRRIHNKNLIMKSYMDKYLPLSEKVYDRASILRNPPIADVFICGSDQVWNFGLREDPTYFLDFTRNNKETIGVAYAPSIADPWPKTKYLDIKSYLQTVDYLSVREMSDIETVEMLSEKHVEHVVDPVFLQPKEFWEDLANDPIIEGPYILCYFLGTDDFTVDAVRKVQAMTGYPIVHININLLDKFHSKFNLREVDPSQFLGFIKNAEIVCTNSFHCSAFSAIFHKKYFVIPKGFANERMKSLQDLFGINDRFLTESRLKELTSEDFMVDYDLFDLRSVELIRISKQYLDNAIKGKRN